MIDLYFPYRLYENYNFYDCKNIISEHITYSQYEKLIKNLPGFVVKEDTSHSVEGKDIHLFRIGRGPKNILLWSQMHGNEPTGTKFFFDLVNFFSNDDFLNDFRQDIFNNLSIYFIPMLNPDGAEKNIRYNALGLDINRDFLAEQTLEGRFLKICYFSIEPEYCFNLHNQSRNYSTINTKYKPSVLSIMAPPVDNIKTYTENYDEAIRFCGYIYKVISNLAPGHIAKYNDSFEPTAFGDNFQALGSTTILLEAGFWKTTYKFVNKIYFIATLNAIYSTLRNHHMKITPTIYKTIPENNSNSFDIIFKNVSYNNITIDIALNIIDDNYYVIDYGDLSNYSALQLFNLENHKLILEVDKNNLNLILDDNIIKLNFLPRNNPANFAIMLDNEIKILFENGKIITKE
ncbi:MAG TPA: M14 family zinc carboxypeptidase [Ignavibacteriales bacterium]|nr:M14 family zinc carboxypeptidase [Ignavibacteriales bacterium]HOL80687.1 M14 family zinc carboxypeptidase [Ignavibacteriales bacterium]HOM64375.1 M14 family zinc carboxypeptidase [Ignavibacteriales bacterium]HPD67163.1 M14 family zinc carboxypeptidase [Ignavibacteriales bacterium]HPP32980.1 M14 family zinc carboxypeptidase [Ignavibacteriales bacterium]